MKPVPYKLAPLEDESPTSWLLRLAFKYHCDVITFLHYYECEYLIKTGIDIDSDLSSLQQFIPTGYYLPMTVSDKVKNFQWVKRRSKWLIEPNRKGSASLNSFTQICAKCLNQKGYYQLKWKLSIFNVCVECRVLLVRQCSKCKKKISLHQHLKFLRGKEHSLLNTTCDHCEEIFIEAPITRPQTEPQAKVLRAYSENPPNWEFLNSLEFSSKSYPRDSLLPHFRSSGE